MIGVQPTLISVNQAAGQLAINLRNDMQNATYQNDYLNAAGGAAFLQNTLNMDGNDALAFVAAIGNFALLAQIYQGAASLAEPLNFEQDSNLLWGYT
jgi:hypothetical protein